MFSFISTQYTDFIRNSRQSLRPFEVRQLFSIVGEGILWMKYINKMVMYTSGNYSTGVTTGMPTGSKSYNYSWNFSIRTQKIYPRLD